MSSSTFSPFPVRETEAIDALVEERSELFLERYAHFCEFTQARAARIDAELVLLRAERAEALADFRDQQAADRQSLGADYLEGQA